MCDDAPTGSTTPTPVPSDAQSTDVSECPGPNNWQCRAATASNHQSWRRHAPIRTIGSIRSNGAFRCHPGPGKSESNAGKWPDSDDSIG